MTQQEFETRVEMTVTSKEFDAINEVYMNSDLDKDDFCKVWAKMNKSRIAKAIAERKAEEERIADEEMAFDVYTRLSTEESSRIADALLSDEEKLFMDKIGICLRKWSDWWQCNMFRTVLNVRYDLGIFCGAIR